MYNDEAAITSAVGAFDFDAWWDVVKEYADQFRKHLIVEKKYVDGSITRGIKDHENSPFRPIGGIRSVTHDKNNKLARITYDPHPFLFENSAYVSMLKRCVWFFCGRIIDFATWVDISEYDKKEKIINMMIECCNIDPTLHEYYGVTDEQLICAKLKYA